MIDDSSDRPIVVVGKSLLTGREIVVEGLLKIGKFDTHYSFNELTSEQQTSLPPFRDVIDLMASLATDPRSYYLVQRLMGYFSDHTIMTGTTIDSSDGKLLFRDRDINYSVKRGAFTWDDYFGAMFPAESFLNIGKVFTDFNRVPSSRPYLQEIQKRINEISQREVLTMGICSCPVFPAITDPGSKVSALEMKIQQASS